MKIDFLIKNGHVVDPANGIDKVMNIAIKDDLIVDEPATYEGARVVDATGCYVFPGLIDFHVHIFENGTNVSVHPDYLLATGVTAAVDAGSAGSSNFDAFYGGIVVPSKVRIKSYLCIYGGGQTDFNIIEKFDRSMYRVQDIKKTVRKYRDNILGFKIRMSKGVATGIDALDATRELADELGLGLCVHTTNPVAPLKHVAAKLKKGDIYCHVYHGCGDETILDENGRLQSFILEARERGVLMDVANGRTNFSIDVCRAAAEQGFFPDIISTDWTSDKYNLAYNAKNLTAVMAKFLELGMSLTEVVRAVTATPAECMNMKGQIGTLSTGAFADLAVFRLIYKKAVHRDYYDIPFETSRMFVPQLVFAGGEPAFCQADFGLFD